MPLFCLILILICAVNAQMAITLSEISNLISFESKTDSSTVPSFPTSSIDFPTSQMDFITKLDFTSKLISSTISFESSVVGHATHQATTATTIGHSSSETPIIPPSANLIPKQAQGQGLLAAINQDQPSPLITSTQLLSETITTVKPSPSSNSIPKSVTSNLLSTTGSNTYPTSINGSTYNITSPASTTSFEPYYFYLALIQLIICILLILSTSILFTHSLKRHHTIQLSILLSNLASSMFSLYISTQTNSLLKDYSLTKTNPLLVDWFIVFIMFGISTLLFPILISSTNNESKIHKRWFPLFVIVVFLLVVGCISILMLLGIGSVLFPGVFCWCIFIVSVDLYYLESVPLYLRWILMVVPITIVAPAVVMFVGSCIGNLELAGCGFIVLIFFNWIHGLLSLVLVVCKDRSDVIENQGKVSNRTSTLSQVESFKISIRDSGREHSIEWD